MNNQEETVAYLSIDDSSQKERLKRAIDSKKMKIKHFAREAGMAYPSLRDYYTGVRKPGYDALTTILAFTGVSGDWLILGKGPMFLDEKETCEEVDSNLIAEIARHLTYAYDHHIEAAVAQSGENGVYSINRRRLKHRINEAGERALLMANVYNKVAPVKDQQSREDELKRVVKDVVDLHKKLTENRVKELQEYWD
ncbi:helix-turn-helix domain-containing protein [Acanthopleuribacter pedis]|uniref:HTH cro/C1-type domain-containing protein n=1 Tax=Acanthopleuribacter pedis TaxID=442870 RepID=A0A8J7U5S5_9BACT|nr:helix-turn-helix domain-containing protein [Acanthopleuribacter pedis]MBO1322022.1 hypothetical protein [Acanthopleuribacter pedis]